MSSATALASPKNREADRANGLDPHAVLSDFIGDKDPAEFWKQIDANVTAGRVKLVFVADEIARELARIVEFLNDQMKADVRAVELRWFSDECGTTAMSPRIVGETERAAASKNPKPQLPPITASEWIVRYLEPTGEATAAGAHKFGTVVESAGGTLNVAPDQTSLRASFVGRDGQTFAPLRVWRWARKELAFHLNGLKCLPDLASRRQVLDGLEAVLGTASTANLDGYPAFDIAKLADPAVAARFETWLVSALAQMREEKVAM